MNSVVFGQYYNTNSWVHRLDPRTKLISLVLLMVGLFFVNQVTTLVVMLGLVLILLGTTKIPFGKYLNSLRSIVFLLFFSIVFQVVAKQDGKILADMHFNLTILNLFISILLFIIFIFVGKVFKRFRVLQFLLIAVLSFLAQTYINTGYSIIEYDIKIYDTALINSAFISLRIIILLLISSVLTLTTKPTELNIGLESLLKPLQVLKFPVSNFAMMISIALRFIPTLINEANKIIKAQASRGVEFKESSFKEKINQIISLIVPMFILAYRRASDLADAMEARGYNPDGERTSIISLEYEVSDVISLIVIILVSAFMIFGSIWLGI